MLMQVIPEAVFVDLFAGSGAVGLEAFSRGARRVTWVEKDPRNAALIKENIAALAPGQGDVACCDVTRWLRGPGCGHQADVAFADPPYAAGREQGFAALMALLAVNRVVRAGGVFAAEMPEAKRPDEVAGWTLLRDRTYGHTRLAVYRLEGLPDGGAAETAAADSL